MHEINLPLIIITGVVFLLTVLGSLAFSFSALGLANRDEALGLPSGSVRAVIALMLLVIFAIVAIYLFSVVFAKNEDAGIDLAKQLIVLVGTLVTAVASFYFGSSSIAAVTKPPVSSGGPVAVAVSPGNLSPGGAAQPLTVSGTNLTKVGAVKLALDGSDPIAADSIAASDTSVSCKITVPAKVERGPWDVVVSDNANNFSSVPKSVTINPLNQQANLPSAPKPEPTDVDPTSIKVGASAELLTVTGANLGNVNKVELKSADGKTSIPADVGSVKPSPTTVTCKVTVSATTPTGSYEVIVSDDADNVAPIPKKVITISAT